MTRAEIVEVMRPAITKVVANIRGGCINPHDHTRGECADGHCYCTRVVGHIAEAALAALEARGMVVVPAEPTEAMKAAGWIDKEDVNPADIYCAMLAARPEQE